MLIRMVISGYLRECGYKVIEAISAADIWQILEALQSVDIILADVTLEGGNDGFSLAARVRQTHRGVDVILTSGISGAAEESQNLCDDGPLKKPYKPKDVKARINRLLERRRASNRP